MIKTEIMDGIIFVCCVALTVVFYSNRSLFLTLAFGIVTVIWFFVWTVRLGMNIVKKSAFQSKQLIREKNK